MRDMLHRPLRDLRISVTDRCNFRCTYCMPKEVFGHGFNFLHRDELLTFEEIERLARIFVRLGVEKIRITGGEPLLRRDLEKLAEGLSSIEAVEDLTLTTNGSLLALKAFALRAAGLRRLTVSLDSLDDTIFAAMNDVNFSVARVLEGIDSAVAAGFSPIKINAVVKRGVNEGEILPLARRFRGEHFILRLIEYMDVGNSNGWRRDHVVPAAEMIQIIAAEFPLIPLPRNYPGEVARRFRYADGSGEIGVIASVTKPFCGDCSRARLSSEGKLYTCLFGTRGFDLRALLRAGKSDEEISAAIGGVWQQRDDRYSELRTAGTDAQASLRHGPLFDALKVEMSHIGG